MAMGKKKDAFTDALLPESDRGVLGTSFLCIILAVAMSFFFSSKDWSVTDIVYQKARKGELKASVKLDYKKKQKEKKDVKKDKGSGPKKDGAAAKQKGRGEKRSTKTRGVLKLLTSRTKKSNYSAYTMVNNKKFAKDIDKVLKNIAGLQKGGKTNLGKRKGKSKAAFNSGYFEGGSGGIGNLVQGLLGSGGGAISTKAKGKIQGPTEKDVAISLGGGCRSAVSIMRTVHSRTPGLRHIYNKYLKSNTGFGGKITFKFSISAVGKITKIQIVSSTTGVGSFDKEIKNKIRRWRFEKVKECASSVTVPFTFSE